MAKPHKAHAFTVAQALVCAVILLLSLLFRLIGGVPFKELRAQVYRWLTADGFGIPVEQVDA